MGQGLRLGHEQVDTEANSNQEETGTYTKNVKEQTRKMSILSGKQHSNKIKFSTVYALIYPCGLSK